MVQEMGLEPTQSIPQAPEACVSTNSTTPALKKNLINKVYVIMAALVRFELTMMESESTALPLGYRAIP